MGLRIAHPAPLLYGVYMVATQSKSRFQYVREYDEQFLSLFPHRYDYIWAEHSQAGGAGKPAWKTESRHPLGDRLILQGDALYGVRFGAETQYCIVDIDFESLYHPRHDPFAISRMVAALEPLGLVSFVACTSSYSGGIHLYFPFDQSIRTWQLAIALQSALERAGFRIALGQLEIFPNPKLYVSNGQPSLYAAHRLPLQAGSYLLDSDWQLIYTTRQSFVEQWRIVAARNAVSSQTIENLAKSARQRRFGLSGKADKFLNDLNTEIELGWTGAGQTNYLLGRIAIRSYVFGHLLYGVPPLVGKPLVDTIVKVAQALPGYVQWCRHQHEIVHRAEEWARCVESSHYFQFQTRRKPGTVSGKDVSSQALTWNQQQQQAVRERICRAIADLLNRHQLPVTTTARFKALVAYGIGGSSLYRHRDLWHPEDLSQSVQGTVHNTVHNTVQDTAQDLVQDHVPILKNSSTLKETDGNCVGDAFPSANPTSLLGQDGSNSLCGQAYSDALVDTQLETGCNNSDLEPGPQESGQESQTAESIQSIAGIRYVQQALQTIVVNARQQQARRQERALQSTQARQQVQQAALANRMQRYLESGDPILVREAIAWMERRSPGCG